MDVKFEGRKCCRTDILETNGKKKPTELKSHFKRTKTFASILSYNQLYHGIINVEHV